LAAELQRLRHSYGSARRREAILSLCRDLKKGNALDCGSADGFITTGLSHQGWYAIALDISVELLKRARRRGVEVVAGDLENLPFRDSQFELAVCAEVFEHLANSSYAVRELNRVVKSDGHVIVSLPNLLWEPLFKIADYFRMKVPEKAKRFITIMRLREIMKRSGFEIGSEQGIVLWPFPNPGLMERVSRQLEDRFPLACATIVNVFRKN
jgi:ubiquinone/menaquinone biosynthesis C-methylase UbiE